MENFRHIFTSYLFEQKLVIYSKNGHESVHFSGSNGEYSLFIEKTTLCYNVLG